MVRVMIWSYVSKVVCEVHMVRTSPLDEAFQHCFYRWSPYAARIFYLFSLYSFIKCIPVRHIISVPLGSYSASLERLSYINGESSHSR